MKILKKIDYFLLKVITAFAGIMIAGIVLIVLIQVTARNVFSLDIGNLANFPVLFMTAAIWMGGILAARGDDHISIKLLPIVCKSEKVLKVSRILIYLLTMVIFAIFTVSSIMYVDSLYVKGIVDTSVDLPKWLLVSMVPVSTGIQSIYYLVHLLNEFIGGAVKEK